MPRSLREVNVTPQQRKTLKSRQRSRSISNGDALRARIVLLAAQGESAREISERLGISVRSVYKWTRRFQEDGIEGLEDKSRSERPRTVDADKIFAVLQKTLTQIPLGCTNWSVRLMADAVELLPSQVHSIWQQAGIKPHRTGTFKISRDPNFANKLINIVGLYMEPPDGALVLSVDEKTQIQAFDSTQPMLPLKPRQFERRTHDYKRHGTVSLYAALDLRTRKVLTKLEKRHRAEEFIGFLEKIDRTHPRSLAIHVILDNSSTHRTPEVKRWLAEHPRFQFHFTPTSASWLNAVETWFSTLERRAVRRGPFCSVLALRRAVHASSTLTTASTPSRSSGPRRPTTFSPRSIGLGKRSECDRTL